MAVRTKKSKSSNTKKEASSNGPSSSTRSKTNKGNTKQSAETEIIPVERVMNAVKSLQEYLKEHGTDESSLLDDSELKSQLQLVVVNTESFSGSLKNFKPKLVTVPHSVYKPWKEASTTMVKDFKTLLILKDADANAVSSDDLIDILPEHITIDSIVTGKDLKTKYKAFEKRRAFVQDFSLILADDSIVTALPKLLGGKAYSKLSTTPIAINTRSDNKFNKTTLVNSIKKVYDTKIPTKIPRGNTLNVHLGSLEWFSPEQLAENIVSVAKQFIEKYNIRTVLLKSNESPVLPLYVNLDVLDTLVKSKQDSKVSVESDGVEIDGVEIQLSQFDKSLLQIANPDELDTLFAKQIKQAKRNLEEVEKEEEKEKEHKEVAHVSNKKQKKAAK
ncbi:Proteasome-interacting protein CIC1 [Kluyveromyces marxianus]